MSRESRLVMILVVMAAIGVSGLMLVANQYRRALDASAAPGGADAMDASVRAVRLVDGFLAAREAAKSVAAQYPGTIEQLTAPAMSSYRLERFNALSAHGMTYEDYAAVRASWRAYRAGEPVDDAALAAAFRARSRALEDAALGPIEAVDDAIK